MKKRLNGCHQNIKSLVVFFLFLGFPFFWADAQTDDGNLTTFILVRHAEKIDNSKDPALSEAGYDRVKKLTEILSRVELDAVYSTSFKRTRETIQPLADANNVSIRGYDYQNPDSQIKEWFEIHSGETVLISGHSNTTPAFANSLLAEQYFDGNFEEDDYGNILIVSIGKNGERKLLHLRY